MADILILIVEDDPAVGLGLKKTLERQGFDVYLAPDAPLGLEWLEDHSPHLIIADIMMPGMNGYQFYQRVRQNVDWLRIPFIFLTARSDVEDIRYGKELGADDYLTKPIDPQDLIAAVRGRLIRYEQLDNTHRSGTSAASPRGKYQIEGVEIDLARREALVNGLAVSLSPTEFGILQRLLLADGGVVGYEDLLGYEDEAYSDKSDAAQRLRYPIRDLRNKLQSAGEALDIIVNVRGSGYRLISRPLRL